MGKHAYDYVLSELGNALCKATDEMHAAARRAHATQGRVPCPTVAEMEAYVQAAVTAAARRIGISEEIIALADKATAGITGWRRIPAGC